MAPPNKTSNSDNGDTPRQDVLLPLVASAPSELTATNSVAYHLLSNPADTTSSKYKVIARIITGTEDVRTLILWSKEVDNILKGLGLTTDAHFEQGLVICRSMMQGRVASIFDCNIETSKTKRMNERAQDAFDSNTGNAAAKAAAKDAIIQQGWAHADNNQYDMIREALNNVLIALMPKKVLARCKRHLRRSCRKPRGMPVREYVHLVQHMNHEFTCLPPFGPNQELPSDEILDVILFGTPKHWEKEMDKQGFDPLANTLAEVVAKLEDIETAEGFDAEPPAKKTTTKKDKKRPSNNNNNNNTSESGAGNGKKHCMYHGWGSHTTDECEHLKQQVKKLKTGNDTKKDNDKKSGDGKKGNDGFATLLKQTVKTAVNKAIKSHKRKADNGNRDLAAYDIRDFAYDADTKDNTSL